MPPLGVIALLASLQASRNADTQRRADVRIALSESTRKLNIELSTDVAAMRAAANAIAFGASPEEACARLSGVFAAHSRPATPFALFGLVSSPICTTARFDSVRPSTVALDPGPRAVIQGETLDVIVPSQTGSAVTIARYPIATLRRFVDPSHLDGGTFTGGQVLSPDSVSRMTTDERLAYMANQIALNFAIAGEAAAALATADHIASFWDPGMKARIFARAGTAGGGLNPIAAHAVALLRTRGAPSSQSGATEFNHGAQVGHSDAG